jgi:hypothetical protein
MDAKEKRQHERLKLEAVENQVAVARTALDRARKVAGDRPVKGELLALQVRTHALQMELVAAVQRLDLD